MKIRIDTAEAIRDAADELFCQQGYDGVSVRDIAERAGVHKALVFYHYRSKADLFERVLERYYEAHRQALADAYGGVGTIAERMHRMIDAYLDFMIENRRYAVLIQQQVANPETHPLIARNLTPLFEWLREALRPMAPDEGPLAARHFFVTFSAMVINYFTYAPLLTSAWPEDPMAALSLQERRGHLHWMVDTVLARMAVDPTPAAFLGGGPTSPGGD